ncbi:hypothetical protein SLA2020_449450 [Shorea laevis]
MACMSSHPSSSPSLLLPTELLPSRSVKPTSLSWTCSFPKLGISSNSITHPSIPTLKKDSFIQAAYTRRSRVMHRGTSKVISVATTNSKDLRFSLPSLTDHNACRVIGKLIAERSKEADVFAISYEPRKNERIEGKLGIVIDTIRENGIMFV